MNPGHKGRADCQSDSFHVPPQVDAKPLVDNDFKG
jgi:nitrate reductase cytochrome c-type subunit